jgi:plastocyanin
MMPDAHLRGNFGRGSLGLAMGRKKVMSFTVGGTMRTFESTTKFALFVAATLMIVPDGAAGQGPVSGQVSIVERPGEQTEDLGNTVIYLDVSSALKWKGSPATESMALQSRQFSPQVRIVPMGSKVEFSNQDPFSHNVFSKATQGPFDTDVFGRGKKKSTVVKEAGVYPLYCNVHPRMTGYIVGVNTPYFAQSGADGRFSIGNVPPGTYVIHVWHSRAPEQTATITVGTAGIGGLKYQLDARNYKFVQHKNKNGKDYTNSGDVY